jgi:glycosyltransferase involved in cell wall biosynthesis
MQTILLISPYWREPHRWMVSSYKLAELWQRRGFRVVVVCLGSHAGRENVSDTLSIIRVRDWFLPDPWNYGIALGFSRTVRRLVREERPDHVVCNKVLFWTSLSVLSLRLRGVRVTLLTDALVGMTWWPRGKLPQVCAALYAWTLGWLILLAAQRIVFFHPQPPTLLRRLGIAHKSRVIPTGIDPLPFTHERTSPTESVRVTYVGRLESVKGADDFLAAATDVQRTFPALQIAVAGRCDDTHPLVQQYGRQVHFLGLRDDIAAVLRETDIFVLPSYSEGLSNALMEAMASGCACITSEVGGNAFLIQNGVSGLLFPAGDRAALQAHLRRLLADPTKRQNMGRAAQQRIEAQFSWEVVGKQYDALFSASA